MLTIDLKFLLINLVLLLSNLNIFSFGENNLIMYPFIILFLLRNIPQMKGRLLIFSAIFSFGCFVPLMAVPIDIIKESIFLLQFIFGFLVFKNIENIENIFKYTLIFVFIIALIQWLLPQSESLFSGVLSRFSMPQGFRGASSVFQEPSFYSFFCSAIFLMLWAEAKLQPINGQIWCLILLNLIASGSAILLIVFPFMFIALKVSYKLKLIIVVIFLYFILNYSTVSNIGIRYVSLLLSILDGTVELDTSASSRLFYILKDLNQFYGCSVFLPTLAAGYQASFELCGSSSVSSDFIYNPALSGSLLGRYLVQFGIITVVFLIWLFCGLQGKLFYKILGFISFCILFLQMIPITFPIVGVALGYLTSIAYYRKNTT